MDKRTVCATCQRDIISVGGICRSCAYRNVKQREKTMARSKTREERIEEVLHAYGVSGSGGVAEAVNAAINDVPNVRIVVGHDANSLQVFVDGKDIARALRVRRLVIEPLECDKVVRATFTVYAQAEVELLPENVIVVVTDPESLAHDDGKLYTGRVTLP